jgi:hypothetical protein
VNVTTAPLEPRLDILPAAQRRLWDDLTAVPSHFILYGGTGIAVRLGHRASVDFDFFAFGNFDTARLYRDVSFLAGATVVQQAANTLTCRVDRGGPVLVSFFGVPLLGQVTPPDVSADNGLRIAALSDLAGMKAAVVQSRSEAKDYVDVDALIQAGVALPTALAAAAAIYWPAFNPQITLKALCYIDDGNLPLLPDDLKRRLVRAVETVDLDRLPTLSPIRQHVQAPARRGQ